MSNIFWDYGTLDTSTNAGMKTALERKIMFGVFTDGDIPNIFRHIDTLDMVDYWRYYFTLYSEKYGSHGNAENISRLDR